MKAIRVHAPGGPETLRLEDVPEPRPEPGEVVVRTEATGVNFIEVYQRKGLYPLQTPFTPGGEGAGTVVAVEAPCWSGPGPDAYRWTPCVVRLDVTGQRVTVAAAKLEPCA